MHMALHRRDDTDRLYVLRKEDVQDSVDTTKIVLEDYIKITKKD